MAESAFIVRVPEAEACVGALRERYDTSVQLGVTAHVTVLVPFMSPDRITDVVLRQAQAALNAVSSFSFSLCKVARFPATTYLAPEPAQPFVELTQSLVLSFPEYLPFRGEHDSIIPHLTVAHGSAPEAEVAARELAAAVQAHGPIHSVCGSVVLIENSSGQWREMHAFVLPRGHQGFTERIAPSGLCSLASAAHFERWTCKGEAHHEKVSGTFNGVRGIYRLP